MSSLSPTLRRRLETTVREARTVAENGARKALEALAVHESDPYRHMDKGQRDLRRRLRAQARQLGDEESRVKRGVYEIGRLVEKLAYDRWHRVLFARFLLENDLLISPEHGVAITLDDCEELAPSLWLKDAWDVAAHFASKELPQIFPADDPAGAVNIAVEDRNAIVRLVTEMPSDVFTASDSLGWCYQFWQAERKDAVNASGNKIGPEELPAVTQLFTEDYMVDFLLDNTIGAWHAGKLLRSMRELAAGAASEEELRKAVALPGCSWAFLRFVRGEDQSWSPAAGTFADWPRAAKDFRCLDPCMGSGHFVVALFERLVALRIAEEQLEPALAVESVIRENVFGLEIDARCTQLGAFSLALAAWRRAGYRRLPAINLACCGLAPNAGEDNWVELAGQNARLQRGMSRLYSLFRDAPILGSLINPSLGKSDLLEAEFNELQPLLERALSQEPDDAVRHEMTVTAHGLAKAAEILGARYTLVATNVPYLGRGKQEDVLKRYSERVYPDSKADLATCFVERCLEACAPSGRVALVTPQNWLFQSGFQKLRSRLLRDQEWAGVAKLGTKAFHGIGGEVVTVALAIIGGAPPSPEHRMFGIDVGATTEPEEKALELLRQPPSQLHQAGQLRNPDSVVLTVSLPPGRPLAEYADSFHGISTTDYMLFGRTFWELPRLSPDWVFQQSTVKTTQAYGGREHILWWEGGEGRLRELRDLKVPVVVTGLEAWNRAGVAVSQMNDLPVTLYTGQAFDDNTAIIVPRDTSHLPAIWEFCSSVEFSTALRIIDQSLKVTYPTLVKVPFDLDRWMKAAVEKNSHGLPKPFSSDPSQWLFSGHPKGADQPLQVAVARLLGYKWPRQVGSKLPDCPALGLDGLETLGDDDGIVCLAATKGEAAAAERLRGVLAMAWGTDWNAAVLEGLLSKVGYSGRTLEDWLRNGFFEQHCNLFHDRPFIWQIWDGHKSGFSALVNYHRLDHANLQKLTYAYLGDWVRRQQAAVDAGESGSDARLQAAKALQGRLELILQGEPPYDLFVRWKPLARQAIGWQPDINDGVRLNIRPFMAEDIPGSKKGAGILRAKPNIKWEKDRGKEPEREKKDFPWFWGWDGETQDFAGVGKEPDGNRWNSCHYTHEFKSKAREAGKSR